MIEPVRVKAGKKMNTKQFLSDILDEFKAGNIRFIEKSKKYSLVKKLVKESKFTELKVNL